MTTFRFMSAAEWGMRWGHTPRTEHRPDDEVYVHHTAGGTFGFPEDAAAAFRAMNEWEIGRGHSGIVYDVVVHYAPIADVCTIGGAREGWMSASQLNRNEQGEGVGVFGMFHPGYSYSRHPYAAEVEGVARAIDWGIGHGWVSTRCLAEPSLIRGHRDNPNQTTGTPCPGDWMYPELPTIRRRVGELNQEDDMPARFFRVGNRPAVWVTTDGLTAVRVDADQYAAHNRPRADTITANEAKKYAFVDSVDRGVVV